jgi:hypothetical protein
MLKIYKFGKSCHVQNYDINDCVNWEKEVGKQTGTLYGTF